MKTRVAYCIFCSFTICFPHNLKGQRVRGLFWVSSLHCIHFKVVETWNRTSLRHFKLDEVSEQQCVTNPPKQRCYLFLRWFISDPGPTRFKAVGVCFSSDPTGPVGMMYAWTGMPTMNTLNHHSLVRIGLMKTIWTTVSQTPAHMNGIPFHTRRRTLIFPFPPLSTSVTLFHKSCFLNQPPSSPTSTSPSPPLLQEH